MKIKAFAAAMVLALTVLFLSTLAVAQDKPQEMIFEVVEALQKVEDSVRKGDWAAAAKELAGAEVELRQLINNQKLSNESYYLNTMQQLMAGMKKSIAEKEDEEFEIPLHSTYAMILEFMENIDFGKAPVFVLFEKWIEEAMEYLEEGNLEAISEEMEEIVSLRKEAREAVKDSEVNTRKVGVLFDTVWDVETAIERKKTDDVKALLTKMAKLLESI